MSEHILWETIDEQKEKIADLKRENLLLGERCNQLLKDKGDLTDTVRALEAVRQSFVKDNEKLEEENNKYLDVISNYEVKVADLEKQIEKMKRYGKLLQDICTVMGNDIYMVAVGLENRVKVLWNSSEEKEGLKMVEDIENRLLKIKPQDWAEIDKWEIIEND